MSKLVIGSDEEIRCELIRLYLEQEHPAIISQYQEEVLQTTNHMVRSRKDVKNARIAYARRHDLVGNPPEFPAEPVLPTPQTTEEKKTVSQAWNTYYKAKKAASAEYKKWLDSIFKVTKNIPELEWRKDNYQTLRTIYGKIGPAVLFRDVVVRVNKTKGAKSKKNPNDVPLEFRNSEPLWTGSFYGDRRGKPFYNALVHVPGLGRIKGRLRRPLPGKPIQGVTLTKKADGWYASIKCIVKKRQLPEPVLPAVGVDVGQTDLVALSDGYMERNIRDAEFVAQKAAIQETGDRSTDLNFQKVCRDKVARMDQNRKRRIIHWINSDLLPRLEKHSYVFVEKLAKNFKSDKGPLSCMHMILDAIKQRLGNRVREVECAYTSQTCSQCGNSTEVVRKAKYFSCLASGCMATLDADINAACNILAKGLKLLEA